MKMMYFKSIYTGNCYADTEPPKFGGYIQISEAEFNAWCASKGF